MKRMYVLAISLLCIIFFAPITLHAANTDPLAHPILGFDKVIIWGHKLHSHTHSYIHAAFDKAFKHLGYDTYWLDNNDNVTGFDFSKALFLTEWQVDQNMPLRDDCFYVIHNIHEGNREIKYRDLINKKRCISLRVYRTDFIPPHAQKMDDYVYYCLENQTIYMPWATDLLPHEIDTIKRQLPLQNKSNTVYFVGTVDAGNAPEIYPFKKACEKNGITFIHLGGYGDGNVAMDKLKITTERNIQYIQNSVMAPTLVRAEQCQTGYIPCRIFKNISYGQFGITNSKTVYELFDKKIIYNADPYQLFFDAREKLKTVTQAQQLELMDFVKNKHTYINRIQQLLDFFQLVYAS